MKETTVNKIIEYFNRYDSMLTACIEELDAYNGYLGDDRYYEMDLLNDFYSCTEPLELLQRAYFGRDNDSWTTDSRGDKHYGEFNPNRDYFKYNGYGNLVSTNYRDYNDFNDEYLVQALQKNRQYIYSIEEDDILNALFDELETEANNVLL